MSPEKKIDTALFEVQMQLYRDIEDSFKYLSGKSKSNLLRSLRRMRAAVNLLDAIRTLGNYLVLYGLTDKEEKTALLSREGETKAMCALHKRICHPGRPLLPSDCRPSIDAFIAFDVGYMGFLQKIGAEDTDLGKIARFRGHC